MHPEVYNPAEDTFLLLDAIDVTETDTVFEMGTGTGIIALACAQKGASVLCSDINPFALYLAKKNYEQNKKKLPGIITIKKGSLFDVVSESEQFSLIIFNPPYLPTSNDDSVDGYGWFDAAVDGGLTGLKLTLPFLENLSNYLYEKGRAFTLFSTASSRDKFNKILRDNHLKSIVVSSLSFTDETVEVHKIIKK